MPIYEYRCDKGHTFDVMQRMADDPLTACEVCEAPVQKVLHPVAVHFKGSGFYTTDYGKKGAKSGAGDSGGDSSANGSGSASGSSDSASGSSSDSGSSSSDSKGESKKKPDSKPAKSGSKSD